MVSGSTGLYNVMCVGSFFLCLHRCTLAWVVDSACARAWWTVVVVSACGCVWGPCWACVIAVCVSWCIRTPDCVAELCEVLQVGRMVGLSGYRL